MLDIGRMRAARSGGLLSVRELLGFLFGMQGLVTRRAYVVSGAALMALKYAGDAALLYAIRGTFFTPLEYLNPVANMRLGDGPLPGWAVFAMITWSVPFLWIGLSMSLRRAVDAGFGAGTALWFLLPIVNLALIAWLSFAPTRVPQRADDPVQAYRISETRIAITSVVGGAALSLVLTALGSQIIGGYGAALFVGTPALVGFVTGWQGNRHAPRSIARTLSLAAFVTCLSAAAILLFALEGVLCLGMLLPLALPLVCIGALLGRAWASRMRPRQMAAVLIVFPLLMGAEHGVRVRAPLRAVTTAVTIAAPPQAVWPHVIGFSELPPPSDLVFAAGIAYPMRAEIRGEGVGAVRHCVFSTGPFVEPITVWDPPRRLAFDVTEQPPGMRETSPYDHVYAPHLDGYPQSERGEFRLVPTNDGGTRLIGTTWYRIDMFPQLYWTPLSDAMIHAIHERVLEHIRALSEAG
jgi:hypothetical protein